MLSVAITFFIGKELYNEYVGVLAAFLLAIFPMFAIYSTTMSDNPPLVLFISITLLAFIYGTKRNSRFWYFISGLSFLIMPYVTPLGFIVWILGIIFIIIELVRRKFVINKVTINIFYGFLAGFILLSLFNYINCGNPIITITENFGFFSQTNRPDVTPLPLIPALEFYPQVLFPYNFSNSSLVYALFQSYQEGFNKVSIFFYVFSIAGLYLIIKRDRRAYIPIFWSVTGILLLILGPQSIKINPFVYVISHRLDRYTTIVGPTICIVIASAIVKIVQDSKKKFQLVKLALCFALIILITFTSIQIINFWYQLNVASQYDQIHIADYISSLPNSTKIYISSGMGNVAIYADYNNLSRFYFGYGGVSNCHEIPDGSYVVMPRYENDGYNYTPNPLAYCSYWQLTLSPVYPNLSRALTPIEMPFAANLYYIPKNNQTS